MGQMKEQMSRSTCPRGKCLEEHLSEVAICHNQMSGQQMSKSINPSQERIEGETQRHYNTLQLPRERQTHVFIIKIQQGKLQTSLQKHVCELRKQQGKVRHRAWKHLTLQLYTTAVLVHKCMVHREAPRLKFSHVLSFDLIK